MPFSGYGDFGACVSANSDKRDPEAYCGAIKRHVEGKADSLSRVGLLKALATKQNDPERICGDLWFNRHAAYADAFGDGAEGRSPASEPPEAWWDDCVRTIAGGMGKSAGDADAGTLTARQKATAATGFDVVGPAASVSQKQVNELDLDGLSDDQRKAVEADDFVIYGKASIEKRDIENQRIHMKALERALDRFFDSQDAPGIISRGHADVPVGRPVREHTLDEPATLAIDGEVYEFDAGDTLRTGAKDADGDDQPELWLASRLANDSELARETRLAALRGELDGYSVTVYPREVERTHQGEDVTEVDLHAVTVGSDEAIKNKGSEFDVAEFKALVERAPNLHGRRADDAIDQLAEDLAQALLNAL